MITKIEINGDDITFYLLATDGSYKEIPYSVREFNHRSYTQRVLRKIEKLIIKHNRLVL